MPIDAPTAFRRAGEEKVPGEKKNRQAEWLPRFNNGGGSGGYRHFFGFLIHNADEFLNHVNFMLLEICFAAL
jgi:hypothetical protein